MRTNREPVNILPRIAAIVLAMLFAAGNMNVSNASGPARTGKKVSALATSLQEEAGAVHRPLASVGVTMGQTARINVVCSPDPNSSIPPSPVTVEMCFHDSNGELTLDRFRRPVQKTATIDPHHGDPLDMNGNLVAGAGGRVVIVPCVRILSVSEGTLAVPTLELFNNLLRTTLVLNPGTARGFDPQPDPAVPPEVAFGLVGITQGETARLYVNNAQNPNSITPPDPITVEMEFHDANGTGFLDRSGRQVRKIVTVDANHFDFLDLKGNDIAALGARVGIIPCIKVLRGSAISLVVPTFEMYINLTQQTLLLSNFVSDPHTPNTPTIASHHTDTVQKANRRKAIVVEEGLRSVTRRIP